MMACWFGVVYQALERLHEGCDDEGSNDGMLVRALGINDSDDKVFDGITCHGR
jgi:hypothetical protein